MTSFVKKLGCILGMTGSVGLLLYIVNEMYLAYEDLELWLSWLSSVALCGIIGAIIGGFMKLLQSIK